MGPGGSGGFKAKDITTPSGLYVEFLPLLKDCDKKLNFTSKNSKTVLTRRLALTNYKICSEMRVPKESSSWSCLYYKFDFSKASEFRAEITDGGYQLKCGISSTVPVLGDDSYPTFDRGFTPNTWVNVSNLSGVQYIGFCQAGTVANNSEGWIQLHNIYYR